MYLQCRFYTQDSVREWTLVMVSRTAPYRSAFLKWKNIVQAPSLSPRWCWNYENPGKFITIWPLYFSVDLSIRQMFTNLSISDLAHMDKNCMTSKMTIIIEEIHFWLCQTKSVKVDIIWQSWFESRMWTTVDFAVVHRPIKTQIQIVKV